MRKWIALSLLAALALLALPARGVEISQYSLEFDIQPSGEVRESIHAVFSQEVGESYFNYEVSGEIAGLKVSDGSRELECWIEEAGLRRVRFLVPAGTREVWITFSSGDLVSWSGDAMHFFTSIRLPPSLGEARIRVLLPQGFSLYKEMSYPANASMGTDGSRIYLDWAVGNPEEEIPVSVRMRNPYLSSDWLLIPGILAIFGAGFAWLFFWSRRKSGQAFLKGFTEDEIKVIEILRKRKTAYQNRLVKELGFSKAKMSRITQSLERKGLIQKEKAGKNKRIDWNG